MKKICLIALSIIYCLLSTIKPVHATDPLSGYDSHPNFWPAGSHEWTAKKYLNTSVDPGYDTVWVWSGPYSGGYRTLTYQAYHEGQPAQSREWELWSGDANNHVAYAHNYGGPSESNSPKISYSQAACQSGTTGLAWPNLVNTTLSMTSESVSSQGVCTREGYVAVKLQETWSEHFSELRNSKCDQYLPHAITPNGNQICKSSIDVGLVYQRYARGNKLTEATPSYYLGCEATVYAWGYPLKKANYQNRFRNGARWSDYLGLPFTTSCRTDDTWWNNACPAWSSV
jgi:hypothetical protein